MTPPGPGWAVVRLAGAAVVVAAVALAGCSPSATGSPPASAGPSPTATLGLPSSPIVGVVTLVDAVSVSEVSTFTLRTSDGPSYEFEIGPLENATEFPPAHLHEHLATATPVRVFFTVEPSRLVAYRIEDAGT